MGKRRKDWTDPMTHQDHADKRNHRLGKRQARQEAARREFTAQGLVRLPVRLTVPWFPQEFRPHVQRLPGSEEDVLYAARWFKAILTLHPEIPGQPRYWTKPQRRKVRAILLPACRDGMEREATLMEIEMYLGSLTGEKRLDERLEKYGCATPSGRNS